ncbi:MAG: hypothetical protein DRO11_05085 [Methanobacteriota archaeon]|nr:MAG: hypothetical protein DRO11_05085 [Euryarchaeota archaeon]
MGRGYNYINVIKRDSEIIEEIVSYCLENKTNTFSYQYFKHYPLPRWRGTITSLSRRGFIKKEKTWRKNGMWFNEYNAQYLIKLYRQANDRQNGRQVKKDK